MTTSQCAELVGKGAVQYRCRLKGNHDGPCVATENGPSQIARGRWEAEQLAPAPVPAPTEVPPASVGEILPRYTPKYDFRHQAMSTLGVGFPEMPSSLRSWVLGAESQMVLNDIWRALIESGEDAITIDRAVLEHIIPDALRR
jgi:hypothetical protein